MSGQCALLSVSVSLHSFMGDIQSVLLSPRRLGLSRAYARYGMFNHHHFGSPVRCLLSREHCCLALLIAGYTPGTEVSQWVDAAQTNRHFGLSIRASVSLLAWLGNVRVSLALEMSIRTILEKLPIKLQASLVSNERRQSLLWNYWLTDVCAGCWNYIGSASHQI